MNEVCTTAPAPTTHVFLYELAKLPTGRKVRFLCCVLEYEIRKARLRVEHAYPSDAADVPRATVEISQVLEVIKSTDVQAGSWLNVVGYVHRSQSAKSRRKREAAADAVPASQSEVNVQAVLVWNAGAIRLAEYERVLAHQIEARKIASANVAGQP